MLRLCVVVTPRYLYRSFLDLNELFKRMFPDSEVSSQLSLSKTKCRHFISYGIAPCFKDILKQEINSSPFFSLSFNESRILFFKAVRCWNSVNWKVLELLDSNLEEKDLNIKYWFLQPTYCTGTSNTEWTLNKILKAMYYVLSDSPAKRDYINQRGGG